MTSMTKLKKALFVETYRYYRQWKRLEDDGYSTEWEVMGAQTFFQIMLRFIRKEGLEQAYYNYVQELCEEEE